MILGFTRTHEAERQASDPYPFHTPAGALTDAERMARRLRMERGVRIAVGRTTLPAQWSPHPDDLMKLKPGCDQKTRTRGILSYFTGLLKWKSEMAIGCRHEPKSTA